MDHVPDVSGQRLNLSVPYLLAEGGFYDRKGWDSFPERAGYPQLADDITVQDLNAAYEAFPQQEFQAFAQAWMFFGVLHEFLGEKMREEDFTRETQDNSGRRIYTESVRSWEVHLSKDDQDQDKLTLFQASVPISVIGTRRSYVLQQVYAKNLLWDLFAKDKDVSWATLALSFRLIYEALAFVLEQAEGLRNYGNTLDNKLDLLPIQGPSLDLIRAHFKNSEPTWCVHQVNFLCTRLSYSALVFLTGLTRTSREGVDHSRCRHSATCVAYNIAVGTDFVTAHAEPDCTCEHVEAPREERTTILRRGGIAVLSCEKDKDGNFDLHFVPASPELKYAAISHLWSDGLGNAFGNSLPLCQLTRLVDAVRSTDSALSFYRDQTLFWLDVYWYCVPAQTPKTNEEKFQNDSLEREIQKELKQLAIARMGATYVWARYVLVFDHELMRVATRDNAARRTPPKDGRKEGIPGPNPADTRAIASLAVSAWNTRCWTYQEHSLAKKSILQGDGCQLEIVPLSPKTILEAGLQREFLELASRQSIMAGGLIENAERPEAALRRTPYSSKFCRAWNAFRGRTTSQWEDMIAVLATLLDLDAGAVLKLHTKDRMRAILGSQATLPLSLLFAALERSGSRSGAFPTRLQDRWIPTKIQSVHLECPEDGDLMQVRDDGLFIESGRLAKNAARMIRLSLESRRLRPNFHYSFNSGRSEPLFWLDVDNDQIEACVNASYWEPSDMILVLEMLDPRVKLDHSITLRGACLMPAGPVVQGVEPVVFICSLKWGLDSLIFDGSPQSSMYCSPSAFPLSPDPPGPGHGLGHGSGVLIQSNIAAWSKLPPARSLRFKRLQGARRAIMGLLSTCGAVWPFAIWIGWGIPLAITFLCLLICAPLHGVAYTTHLQIMYSVHPELDNSASWRRQHLAIFDLLSFREVAIHHRPAHLILWILVMTMSIPDFILRGVKRVSRRGRKADDTENVQLEALL